MGGPIESRDPAASDCRPLAVIEGTRALLGVVVRDAEALDGTLMGFEGDRVGDWTRSVSKRPNKGIRERVAALETHSREAQRPRLPRQRTWTLPIQALSLTQRRALCTSCLGKCCCCWSDAAQTGSFSCWSGFTSWWWLFNDAQSDWFDEHAVAVPAVEISRPLHASIILARLLVQLHANPVTRSEVDIANVPDDSLPTIGYTDKLPGLKVAHCGKLMKAQ